MRHHFLNSSVGIYLSKYWQRIKAIFMTQAWLILLAIIFMSIFAATEAAIPALTKGLLDKSFGGITNIEISANTRFNLLWQAPCFLIAFALIRGLAQFAGNYFLNLSGHNILLLLRKKMFAHILHVSDDFFTRYSTSKLINTLVFEVTQILQFFPNLLIYIVRDSLIVLGLLGYLFYLNWCLTIVVIMILPMIALLIIYISKRLRHLNYLQLKTTNELAYTIEEVSNAQRIVKIYGAQNYEFSRLSNKAEVLRRYAMRMTIAAGINQPITQFLAMTALSLVVFIALLQSGGAVTASDFTAFIIAMLLLISPLKRLADVNQPLQRALLACETVFALLDERLEELENFNKPLEFATNTFSPILLSDVVPQLISKLISAETEDKKKTSIFEPKKTIAIDFIDLYFKYKDTSCLALSNINLHIDAGSRTALVGPSGSGKTTLINLIPRFFSPKSGYIALDGIDIATISLKSLREKIAIVSQDIVLFNDTIIANIIYGDNTANNLLARQQSSSTHAQRELSSRVGKDASLIQIYSDNQISKAMMAIDAAYLTDFIMSLPNGINTIIGDKGSKLSGGQRQRVALARAIYKNAPILILDEANSSLDLKSEREIEKAIADFAGTRTTIVVTHRVSSIENADQIVVLEHGRIVETGIHSQLLSAKNLYSSLL